MWVPAGGPHAQLVLRTGKRMLRDVSLSTVEQTTTQDDGCGNGRAPKVFGKGLHHMPAPQLLHRPVLMATHLQSTSTWDREGKPKSGCTTPNGQGGHGT